MTSGRARRRKIKLRLREEGAAAFFNGKPRIAPREYQGNMDETQWLRGYDEAQMFGES